MFCTFPIGPQQRRSECAHSLASVHQHWTQYVEIHHDMNKAYVREKMRMRHLGVVYTDGGLVKGKNIRLGFRRHMDVFRGIPYAHIPGRFEKPKRHPGWDGVLKATDYRNRCIQVNLLMTDTRGSVDCLYLNIWVPHGRSGKD
ncbi:hypothetical protein F7725_015317 [Dissostichus mawsoni]|uniref:Carboxylesterase type B domain-containing protein n=1 Tax=Dissostichus mawsoni TaxID=36200 RepID=A0A7J5YHF7_DISMA|nr:hypothetical protein F7725_015317 [Dissostichus mawsoni]